jgi:hypothetical protein
LAGMGMTKKGGLGGRGRGRFLGLRNPKQPLASLHSLA